MKVHNLALAAFATLNILAAPAVATDSAYQSPYKLQYTIPLEKLLAPDAVGRRSSVEGESSTPYRSWYSARVKARFGAWGPEPARFPAPFESLDKADQDWLRQRLAAVGEKLIGLAYQHHHIPDWDPPADWPWKEVSCGHQSKGLDCSNFTGWLYNYGLGIKLRTDVHKQAAAESVENPAGEGELAITRIDSNGNYQELTKKLKTGDLLYIKNKSGEISHVIMWLGPIGQSPDGTPLIMDCTGSSHHDCNGTTIPSGVHIRPFDKDSWYFKSFSHAHRIINP
ncbi:MAG: C40 family peptidase [Cyanobacteria bacterium REEB67]|nr:C40 family peptidase [Cyanobacteria bacterium REEB67]